jgi:hypothetical protein
VSSVPGTVSVSVAGILPATMTPADLSMGRGHCAEEEQQRHASPRQGKGAFATLPGGLLGVT